MRWRNMFYATGLPGWMRFGYSPGWGGMPPGAQYLAQPGQFPAFSSWWGRQGTWPAPPWGWMPPPTREQEIDWLSSQAAALEEGLAQIKRRLAELGKGEG
ncbi:DUF5320 domain-containing protein [Candidatus Bipolaricaulota bacterium]|nr:DUF5320 domain-containing protein [Candidatus Bipolaricaulota bacterium]